MSELDVPLPCGELREVLAPAYAPCVAFRHICTKAEWNPARGHVPRGFVGATGSLRDVQLIVLVAEPGGGFSDETYPTSASAQEYISRTVATAYGALRDRRSSFHSNLRFVLDNCWPGESLDEQLRRTWITETYLCSAEKTAGEVPPIAERTCVESYLVRQFALLPGRPIIALGGKAERRVGYRAHVISAFAVGKPGSNSPRAQPSWVAAAAEARRQLGLPIAARGLSAVIVTPQVHNRKSPPAAARVVGAHLGASEPKWYVAESLSSVIHYRDQTSSGRACEGYELRYGTLYMHKVQLTDDEVDSLRMRVEKGILRQQWTLPNVENWYFSKSGKARWPGTNVHSRCRHGSDGKWRPIPLSPEQLEQIDRS